MNDPTPTPTVLTPEEITQRAHDSTHQMTVVLWTIVIVAVVLVLLYPLVRGWLARRHERSWHEVEPAGGDAVTSHMSWSVLVLFVPILAVFDAGLLVAVWRLVGSGDPRAAFGGSMPTVGVVLGWCLVAFFVVAITATLWWLLCYRVTITRDSVTSRTFVRSSTLDRASTQRITFVPERVRPRRTRPASLRFDAVAGAHPRAVQVTAAGGSFGRTLSLVDEWVRARPELVQDDATKDLFARRGALTAGGPAANG